MALRLARVAANVAAKAGATHQGFQGRPATWAVFTENVRVVVTKSTNAPLSRIFCVHWTIVLSLLCCSRWAAPFYLFFFFGGSVHVCSHQLELFLRRCDQTGSPAGLISSFAPATPCGASPGSLLKLSHQADYWLTPIWVRASQHLRRLKSCSVDPALKFSKNTW